MGQGQLRVRGQSVTGGQRVVASSAGKPSKRSGAEPVGVWIDELRKVTTESAVKATGVLCSQGYSSVWTPGAGGGFLERAELILSSTDGLSVGSGIATIWKYPATTVAARLEELGSRFGRRLKFGIGVSHRKFVSKDVSEELRTPLASLTRYFDELEAKAGGAPRTYELLVAALGPKMLAVSSERSDGVYPYLIPPQGTASVRQDIGDTCRLVVLQAATLATSASRGREIARQHLSTYLGLPNYVNNWRRIGLVAEDFEGGGSTRLVDGVTVWGGPKAIRERVSAHFENGADEVVLLLLGDSDPVGPSASADETLKGRMADFALLSETFELTRSGSSER